MAFDLTRARGVLVACAERAGQGQVDQKWVSCIEEFSRICEQAGIRTHIAFLGTAILARATDAGVDVYSVKRSADPRVYSARTLAHEVLVPSAPALGIHLGVTGREPLNNQPYFRMERLGDGTRIHNKAKRAFERLQTIVLDLSTCSKVEAEAALKSFIYVRRTYQPRYVPISGTYRLTARDLASVVQMFVRERSDGGKRAQGVVAGLLDAVVGEKRVFAGKINDPSRHYPGDVAILAIDGVTWEKVFEVRDKQVSIADALIFAQTCLLKQCRKAAVVAIGSGQELLPTGELDRWSRDHGVSIRIFYEWPLIIDELLYWSSFPTIEALALAVTRIHARLISIEAPTDAVERWLTLLRAYVVSE